MKTWNDIKQKALSKPKITIAVARADDSVVLSALKKAKEAGLADAILVGDKGQIEKELQALNLSPNEFEIVATKTDEESAKTAVGLVKQGRAKALMKGLIGTGTLLKAVLDKETGLRSGNLLSHILVAEANNKIYLVTDGGMNMYPDLNQKIAIIENAVKVARALGIDKPNVVPLCAVETVNPDMPCTVEAAELAKMCERGQIKNCVIDGPLALDNAVSIEAAHHKKITGPVAGKADILLVPDIEAGNILGKTLIYFARAKVGGLIAGATAPIILLSRADDDETKFNSIALASAIS